MIRLHRSALAAALALAGTAPAFATDAPEILVHGNRADLVSGGDALVEIRWPGGMPPAKARVALNGSRLDGVFALRPDGRYLGLVTGLRDGFNLLTATGGGAGARLAITSHPIGGPVFSGTQLQPWACSTTSNPSLGEPIDAQCNAPTLFRYVYRNLSNQFVSYDPANPPAPESIASTTTDAGVTMPYIVRIERGTMNRGIHEIAVLADPAKGFSPGSPADQPGWNHKVFMHYGGGTSQRYVQGTPESVLNNEALGRGFVVATSSMMVHGQHANYITVAETTMMLKEHITETYGDIRYTIGSGSSGGALLQHSLADNYPGLLDGLRPTSDWTDSLSGAYREFADNAVLTHAFDTSPLTYSLEDRSAFSGFGPENVGVSDREAQRIGDYVRPDDGTLCAGDASYDPVTNPFGVRCTWQDFLSSQIGLREDGVANLVYDNVGVQYGLKALLSGAISAEKFVDVNARAGGFDVNGLWQPQRSAIDPIVARGLHRAGHVTYGKYMGLVPELAIRGTNNNDYHYPFRTVVQRSRLTAAHGNADNHVYWIRPISGMSTLDAMDRWLAAIEADARDIPQRQKAVENRPADVVSSCGIDGVMVDDLATCDATYPVIGEPRTAAGDATTGYAMKCRLMPLDAADYPGVAFTAEQWAAMQATFPGGVCDFSRPPLGFRENLPWLSYRLGAGGLPMGPAPTSTPTAAR